MLEKIKKGLIKVKEFLMFVWNKIKKAIIFIWTKIKTCIKSIVNKDGN